MIRGLIYIILLIPFYYLFNSLDWEFPFDLYFGNSDGDIYLNIKINLLPIIVAAIVTIYYKDILSYIKKKKAKDNQPLG